MLVIDGSQGEGGGQILRTSLALAILTQTPFRIERIRAGRERPGLMRQHLAAVRAAGAVGQAEVEGDAPGSQQLVFRPAAVVGGSHRFAVGSAGSATLVLQTVLPALLRADGPSLVTVEGGTHNQAAPPFDFLQRTFVPSIARWGARVQLTLERPGFYPAGGGRILAQIEPSWAEEPFVLDDRGAILSVDAAAIVSHLPASIGRRELSVLAASLPTACSGRVVTVRDAVGPGNVVVVDVRSEALTEVFSGFGRKGVPAEAVASGLAGEVRRYLEAGVPVGEHLADQLVLYLALGRGGRFLTVRPSDHMRTQIRIVSLFTGAAIVWERVGEDRAMIEVSA